MEDEGKRLLVLFQHERKTTPKLAVSWRAVETGVCVCVCLSVYVSVSLSVGCVYTCVCMCV